MLLVVSVAKHNLCGCMQRLTCTSGVCAVAAGDPEMSPTQLWIDLTVKQRRWWFVWKLAPGKVQLLGTYGAFLVGICSTEWSQECDVAISWLLIIYIFVHYHELSIGSHSSLLNSCHSYPSPSFVISSCCQALNCRLCGAGAHQCPCFLVALHVRWSCCVKQKCRMFLMNVLYSYYLCLPTVLWEWYVPFYREGWEGLAQGHLGSPQCARKLVRNWWERRYSMSLVLNCRKLTPFPISSESHDLVIAW